MQNKIYNIPSNVSETVNELEVAEVSSANEWNPNVPFHGTQEEWWEHFHEIEQGEFMTWEEHKKQFDAWKKNYLASLIS